MKRSASRKSQFTMVLMLCGLGLLLSNFAPALSAQSVSGGLRGTVTDATGAVVAGATVVARHLATNTESRTTTNSEGAYAIARIPPGTYNVTVEAANFKKTDYAGAEVTIGKDTVINFNLEPGAITETVMVTGGNETLLEKDTVQISTTFQARKVENLPVNVAGGGLDRIALLTPGVTPGFGNVNGNGVTLSANGQRARSNNFNIDGVDNNDLSIGGPSFFVRNSDVVAEFQVITNNYSAEYGRNQGAIVNIVSKSGTNDFHGTGSWFHRDRKHFDSLTNLEKRQARKQPPPLLTNVFRYTVGGPIVKDRAWFFTAGEFLRQPGLAILESSTLSPTPEGIQMLKTAFPNNPAIQYYANHSAFALPLGNPQVRPEIPQTTLTLGSLKVPMAAVRRLVPRMTATDEYNVRGDANLTENHRVWGRWFWQDSPGQDALAGSDGFTGDIPSRSQQIGGGWNWTVSSRSVNEFRFNYSRLFVIFGGGSTGGKGQIPHPDKIDQALAFLSFQFTADNGRGLLNLGPATNLPQGRIVESYQFADNYSFTMGNHNLKAGVDFRQLENAVPFLPNVNGAFVFSNATQFMTNTPGSLTVALGPASLSYDEFDQFYYIQDDWRIRPNLTVNLGLRYENTGQPLNLMNKVTTERESNAQTAFWRQNLPLEARTVPALPTDTNNWAPRVGFVYNPRPSGGLFKSLLGEDKTTIRGGFGIAYDASFYNLLLNISTSSPLVFLTSAVIPVPNAEPTGDKVRAAAVSAGAIRFNTFDPRLFNRTTPNLAFRSPYSEQWSFGVQRELFRDNVLEVRYVGTHGVGQFQTINANPFIGNLVNGFSRSYFDPATNTVKNLAFPGFPQLLGGAKPLTCVNDPATPDNEAACNGRIFPSGVQRERINGAQNIYHGLQARFDGRLRRDLTYGLTYTWSHNIDNSSEVFSFAGGNSVAVSQNPLDLSRAERGNSGFDSRNVFTTHFLWDLPSIKKEHPVIGRILGGWQVNGILRLQTQIRFTPTHLSASRNPYEDSGFMAGFFGNQSHFRPFSGNPNAPQNLVGITDVDACLFYAKCGTSGGAPILQPSSTGFYLLNDLNKTTPVFTPVSPNDVRFIVNGAGAALKFGTPFGTIGRNPFTGDRIENLDLSLFKTTKITEGVSIQYRLTMLNATNTANYGIPSSINLDNAGTTFYNFFENNGGRRTIEMALRIMF